jgi:dolichol kinase
MYYNQLPHPLAFAPVLYILSGMSQPFHYRQEVYRKLIHLSSLWMPAAVYFFEQKTALVAFAACMTAVLTYETVRRQKNGTARLLEQIFGLALRPDEKGQRFKPSGAIYVLAAACLSTLIFPRLVAVTALSMMLTGDAAAALLGRKFGRKKIFDKSLEGGLGFFAAALATAVVIAMLAPVGEGYMYAATAAAVVGALVELVSKQLRIDDNLAVPLAAGGVMILFM